MKTNRFFRLIPLIQSLQFAPLDAKNDRGETPLHWALRAGRVGMPVVSILLDNGAKPAVWSKEFLRPIDVAADGFDDEGSVFELIPKIPYSKGKIFLVRNFSA